MIDRIAITDRDQWLKLRGQDITASIAGCLLGVHPYITPLGAYLLKSGAITEDPEETAPMRRGRLLEPVAVQMLREEQPGWLFEDYPVGMYYRDPLARLGATPDCLVYDENNKFGVVQFKTVEPGIFRKQWKDEDGTVSPPLWVVCQAIVEAHLTGAKWAAVAAMVVGFGIELHVIPVPIHIGIIDRIKFEVGNFWDRITRNDPFPPDYARDGKLIARLYPEANGHIVDLSSDNQLPIIAAEDLRLAADIKELDARRKAIKAEFLAKIGSAAGATFQGGRVTANTVNRKAYSVAATSYRDVRVKLETSP